MNARIVSRVVVSGVLLLFSLTLVMPAAAVPPPPLRISDTFAYGAAVNFSPVNATTTFNDMQFFTTEMGEPQHSCAFTGPQIGVHTAWLAVPLPPGTLTVSTAGSTYDTLVSVYSGGSNINQLVELGCNDDYVASTTSRVSVLISTGGMYYIKISKFGTPVAYALTLVASVTLVGGTPPANDDFASPRVISSPIYSRATVTNIEYASIEADEPKSSCLGGNELSHSVWFKFVAPKRGTMAFSVRGTGQLDILGPNNDTMIAVYRGDSLGLLIEYGCDAVALGYHIVPIIESLNINAGSTYYIQVARRHQGVSPIGPSSFTLVTQYLTIEGNLQNANFSTGTLAPWKLVKAKNGDAFEGCPGMCRFSFKGGPKEKTKLTQKYKLPAGFKTAVGDTVGYTLFLETPTASTTELTVKIAIKYKDGSPATVIKRKPMYYAPAGSLTHFTVQAQTTSKAVANIKLILINKSPAGNVDHYAVTDYYESARVAARGARDAADVLPLPPAPVQ